MTRPALLLALCSLLGACAAVVPTRAVDSPHANVIAQPTESGAEHVAESAEEASTAARRPD